MILPWRKISERADGVGRRKMLRQVWELPNGTQSEYVVLDGGRPCCVLAMTTDQQVILVKQFRPGPDEIILELPGGYPEEGESMEAAMARELLEETGYTGELLQIGEHIESAYDTRRTQDFVATNCRKVAEPNPDDNEFLEVVLMDLKDFRKHLQSGMLSDVETGYLGLDHLGLL